MTKTKEALFLTFFPQEVLSELNRLRDSLTPFLKAVRVGLSVELEMQLVENEEAESLINEIIQNIPAETVTPLTFFPTAHTPDVLHLEFDDLLNIR